MLMEMATRGCTRSVVYQKATGVQLCSRPIGDWRTNLDGRRTYS